jgi:CheY-like chemotaxis protein
MQTFDSQPFLLAEDSDSDVLLMQRAFQASDVRNPLYVVPNGEEAIALLKGEGKYVRDEYPLPFVVLLDLNLPGRNGFEILGWIRSQPDFRRLVVIILTSSNRSADADRAYDLGANFYLTKPNKFADLVKLADCLHRWVQINHFPTIGDRAKSS